MYGYPMKGGGEKICADLDAPALRNLVIGALSDDKVALVVDRDSHGPPKLPQHNMNQPLATGGERLLWRPMGRKSISRWQPVGKDFVRSSLSPLQPIASKNADLPQHTIPHNLWEEIHFAPHRAQHLSQQPVPQPEAQNPCVETQNL